MKELLLTIMLATCPKPPPDKALSDCHEFFINCAITGAGEIKKETVEKCQEKWEEGNDEP